MAFIQVIGMFDDAANLQHASEALIQSGLATPSTMRVEPEQLVEDLHPPRVLNWVERLKDLLPFETQESREAYAQGLARGRQLLVVTVPEEDADAVREIL